MSNELAVIEPSNALTVFTGEGHIDALLDEIKSQVSDFESDTSTVKGRKAIASMAYKIAQTKTYIDGKGKELTAEYKAIPKKIDASRKVARDALDALRDEVRKPLSDWEDEQKRIEEENAAAEEAEKLRAQIEHDHEVALLLDEKWIAEKLEAELEIERQRVARDEEMMRQAAENARLEAESKAKAEQERVEREKQAAIEARQKAECDRIAAEEREKFAVEQAEQSRIRAENKAKQDAIDAKEYAKRQALQAAADERQRINDEQDRLAREQAEREADKEHRRKINNEILEDMIDSGFGEDGAKAMIKIIASGKVRNVRIDY